MKLGGPQPGDDEAKTRVRAWELELEDRALEMFPEIHKLGTFGDPAFEEALERAVDLIDGDGGKSTAEIDLEMDLQEMELNGGLDDAEDSDETVSSGCHCPGRDEGQVEGG